MNANVAASVLGCSLVLVSGAIRLQKRLISKIIIYSLMFVLLSAMLCARSRSGLIALAGTFAIMAFVGRSKKLAWFVIIAAIVVGLTFAGVREAYQRRLAEAYEPVTGAVGSTVAGRFRTWSSYFETATPRIYLLGQGFRQGIARNGMESHNTYISLITVYGIGGVIWAVAALVIFFRKAFILRNFPDALISAVSAGCMWALLLWGIYAMAADALNAAYSRYLLFYLVVLIDRAYSIAREQQELLWYEEEDYQPKMYAEAPEVY